MPRVRTLKLRTGVKWDTSKGLKIEEVSLRQRLETEAEAGGGRAGEEGLESCRWCEQDGEICEEITRGDPCCFCGLSLALQLWVPCHKQIHQTHLEIIPRGG